MENEKVVGVIGAKVIMEGKGYSIKTKMKMESLPKQAMAELILTMEAVVKKLKGDYTAKFISTNE